MSNKLTEKPLRRTMPKNNSMSCYSTRFSLFFLVTFVSLFTLFNSITVYSPSTSSFTSGTSFQKWKMFFTKTYYMDCSKKFETMATKLRGSITFLPLKDLRYTKTAMDGNTWFMSSLSDIYEEDEVEHLYFPSNVSKGRLLCISGRNSHDGGKNLYALAWRDSLPNNATIMGGLTFMSDTYYDYENLWHGLSAVAPFAGWYQRKGCEKPSRWVLYHWGELRTGMGLWVQNLMKATFAEVKVETFEGGDGPFCFEKVVVMRHNLGKMGKEKRLEVYDLLRCKAREFCNVRLERGATQDDETEVPAIRLTLLMRRGARSFKNESAVVRIFSGECSRVEGCKVTVAQSENLSFCDQVKLMSSTDIVASAHGAQLTNMIFMDRNSSIMEFFPKGWLELAGIGKYAHHWMASHSGMKHQGAWWDTQSEKKCPYPEKDPRCFSFYKNGQIGHNETFFTEWVRNVINQVRLKKRDEMSNQKQAKSNVCACG